MDYGIPSVAFLRKTPPTYGSSSTLLGLSKKDPKMFEMFVSLDKNVSFCLHLRISTDEARTSLGLL